MRQPIYFQGGTTGDPSPQGLKSLADAYVPLALMSGAEKRQAFGLWLGIVYVNRNPPPAPLDEGFPASDDPIIVMDFHQDYEAGAWQKLDRGLTVEEMWLTTELQLGQQFICVVNEATGQPMERIERKVVGDADAVVGAALEYFQSKAGVRRNPIAALVSDGEFGHCISLADTDPDGTCFAFFDPWPGRSLLCAENNAAGVEAVSLGQTKLRFPEGRSVAMETWQLSREELSRVMVALLIPMSQWAGLEAYQ